MYINDRNDIDRFRCEQDRDYSNALYEVRSGKKRSHWIWYIFPQLRGLGHSGYSDYYGIRDLEEAKAYLADPVYYARLSEISQAILDTGQKNPRNIFGITDAVKVCSCMTLFEAAEGTDHSVFQQVLDTCYDGHRDQMTLWMIANKRSIP